MSSSPNFAVTPQLWVAAFTTGNTARDGTGTITTVGTAHASAGSKINRIELASEDDLADSIVILWLSLDGGTTWRKWKEIDVGDGANADNTTSAYEYTLGVADRDYNLPANAKLGATITVTPTTGKILVFAWVGDFA